MPKRKRYPDSGAIRHLAAAHGTADTQLIADVLRNAAEKDGQDEDTVRDLVALAEEHERANKNRHLYLR